MEGQSRPSTNELILPKPENQRHKARRHARQLLPLLFGWSGPGFKVAGMMPKSLLEIPTKKGPLPYRLSIRDSNGHLPC